MGSLTLALPLAAADGPLPIGDIAFAVIAVIALCVAHDYSIPETAEISAAVTEADFVDYLRGRAENTCSDSSFRRVSRFPGGLKYLDNYCMDRAEAFLYVQLTGSTSTPQTKMKRYYWLQCTGQQLWSEIKHAPLRILPHISTTII